MSTTSFANALGFPIKLALLESFAFASEISPSFLFPPIPRK